jgi:hypothetical protein
MPMGKRLAADLPAPKADNPRDFGISGVARRLRASHIYFAIVIWRHANQIK